VRQVLAEGVMLALGGAALGVGLAYLLVRLFVTAAPPVIPRMTSISIDMPVLAFTLVVALVTGILFGSAPLLQVGAGGPGEALKEESGRSAGGRGSRRAGRTLVISEIALAVVLLAGAGLMVKSLLRLQRQDLGLAVDRVLSFNVVLPEARYSSDVQARRFYEQALERVRAIAGVQSVGTISALPLRGGAGPNGYFEVEGKTLWQPNDAPLAEWRLVDGDYHRTMGIPLVRGRFFTRQDDERARPVIIVNQSLAGRCWPGEDAIGKRLNVGGPELSEIVGVVGDVRTYEPGRAAPFEIDAPYGQFPERSMARAS